MPAATLTSSGFRPGAGTDFTSGDEPEIARRLDQLAKRLGVVIYGISGARTPAHSVAVGGFANDPHTKAQAADIGVGGMLRASAAQLTDAQLASVGLVRPFAGATEINHVQLKPGTQGQSVGSKIVKGATSGAAAAGGAIAGAPGAVVGAVGAAAGAVGVPGPSDLATSLVNTLWGAVKDDAAKAMLYLFLVGGAVVLAVTGVNHALGGAPARAVKGAAKGAAELAEVVPK